jgi:hypothetical protein
VCDHQERHGIDETLVTGAPYRSVAKRFGLSESSVYRHKTEHLPAHLLKAREVEEAARADDLLDQVRDLQTHTPSTSWSVHRTEGSCKSLLQLGPFFAALSGAREASRDLSE